MLADVLQFWVRVWNGPCDLRINIWQLSYCIAFGNLWKLNYAIVLLEDCTGITFLLSEVKSWAKPGMFDWKSVGTLPQSSFLVHANLQTVESSYAAGWTFAARNTVARFQAEQEPFWHETLHGWVDGIQRKPQNIIKAQRWFEPHVVWDAFRRRIQLYIEGAWGHS